MAAAAILDFKNFNFNGRGGLEGRTASSCQISSKSVKPRLKYGNFSIFRDGGRRHLGFSKFLIFNGGDGQEGRTTSPRGDVVASHLDHGSSWCCGLYRTHSVAVRWFPCVVRIVSANRLVWRVQHDVNAVVTVKYVEIYM